jgi:hypothetical protein
MRTTNRSSAFSGLILLADDPLTGYERVSPVLGTYAYSQSQSGRSAAMTTCRLTPNGPICAIVPEAILVSIEFGILTLRLSALGMKASRLITREVDSTCTLSYTLER